MSDLRELPTSIVDWTRTDAYHNSFLIRPDATLDAARVHSTEQGLPAEAVSPAQGKFLKLIAQSIGAKRVVEVGVLGGYSTIWLAQAVADVDGGEVIAFELKEKHAKVARENIARAGFEKTVKVIVGPAIDGLKALQAQPPFDLVYIDADSKSFLDYFIEAKRLLRTGGIILVDNAVDNGLVSKLEFEDSMTGGVRKLLHALKEDKEVDATTISTVGERGYDGFLYARKL
ncbi:O-methyltransferase family 3 protein [Athelia psychrophila]|uniref:O-methyltransferase family 3 protein n=1 Tax=Athelia psychrophila TaxID=1759441 RepID=A0A166G1W5_9AGAM|nr:O-methyltransferase family 3 protein [Fibularhizoctonia sp. CBS 109695]